MRAVVTGGAGFVGTRVVDRLAERGDEVTIVDLADPERDGATFVEASVLDADAMLDVMDGADAVIHLAGFVRGGMRRDPYSGAALQLQGTLNVLEACRRHEVSQLGFASSFYVYDGIPSDHEVDETTPLDLLTMELFGSAKLMGEALCPEVADTTQTACYRLGPVYGGPGGTSAVDSFVEMGLRGEVIDIWGQGERRNQYTYVGDIADGIVAGLGRGSRTYNLISPESVSLRELTDILADEFGFASTFATDKPEGPSFPFIRCNRAVEELGWDPIELRKGVRLTGEAISAVTGASASS
jgi:nucleoside-diphosphate-sugar epimerase